MSNANPPRSYRIPVDDDPDKFRLVHANQVPLDRRQLPGGVWLGAELPEVDERLTPMRRVWWDRVKAAAERHGCPAADTMSPAQGLAVSGALRAALEAETSTELRDQIAACLNVLGRRRGLRVVT